MKHPRPDDLLTLDRATVCRPGTEAIFRDLTWSLRQGETWAVVGPSGSGKTALADVLLGRCRVESGTLAWPLLDRLRQQGRKIAWPAEVIHSVSFKEEQWPFSYARHYYQQRFNFIEPQDDLTLDAFLRSGTSAFEDAISRATQEVGIESLRSLSLIKLSNGQIRRARIAHALLARPEWLILDEPFMGLDTAGRNEVADLLGRLIDRGLRVLLITRADAIPGWISHVLELDSLAIRWQGSRADYLVRLEQTPHLDPGDPAPPPQTLPPADAEPIIDLRNVHVCYGGKAILDNISWTVRPGERWAVLGPNGSGKTTLLSLLCGDHPQAYSNDLWLFGRKRGTGETIWDIKRQVGLVSPELHLYFSEPLTAERTAATGFFDAMVSRPTTPSQDEALRHLFHSFGIASLAGRLFSRLSTGEQRLVLLIRALVKYPPLLILDEPFQGLDGGQIHRARTWLDQHLRPDQTLLFVSHHEDEIPRTVTRRLRLASGHVVEQI